MRLRRGVPVLVGEGQMALPLRHRRQHRLALGRRAEGGDEATTQHHRGEIGFEHEAPAEGFHQDGELDRAAADTTILGRKWQTEPAEPGELRPDLPVPAGIAGGDLLHGAVVVPLVQKLVGALAQDRVLGGVSKVHGVSRNRMKSGGASAIGIAAPTLSSIDRTRG